MSNDVSRFDEIAAKIPDPLGKYCLTSARSIGVPVETVLIPALAVCGTAIGNGRILRVKDGYFERTALYIALVAASGTGKSPALSAAVRPLQEIETEERRLWTSDTTVEALHKLMLEYPNGLLMVNDELASWTRQMNQYRGGKGADRQFWLSAWSGTPIRVDRKHSIPLAIRNPHLSIVGCIPPSEMGEIAQGSYEDGLLYRMLFVRPKLDLQKWSDEAVPSELYYSYRTMLESLSNLHHSQREMRFDKRDIDKLKTWYEQFPEELIPILNPERGNRFSIISKYRAYCFRIALILQCVLDPSADIVGFEFVELAAEIVKAVGENHASIILEDSNLCSTAYSRCKNQITAELEKGEPVTRRTLQQKLSTDTTTFNAVIHDLTRPQVKEVVDSNGRLAYQLTNPTVSSQTPPSTSCGVTEPQEPTS